MKLMRTAFFAAGILCMLGCSKHPQAQDAMVSLRLTDANESTTMESVLTSFAVKNGFDSKIYSNHDKDPTGSYREFTVEYENRTLKGLNAMKFENIKTGPTETDGCLIVTIVLDDKNADLKSLLQQLTGVIHSNIRDHRTIYVDSICGVKPSTAIE